MNDDLGFREHRPAQTESFEVRGIDGMGYRLGLAGHSVNRGRPYLGWTCITYLELEYLVNTLIGELRDLLRQVDQYPHAGMLMRRSSYQPAQPDEPANHRGLALRFAIFKRDKYRCQICGRNVQEHGVVLEVDHRVPRAKGGTDDPANLWTLCFDCNRGKSDSDL